MGICYSKKKVKKYQTGISKTISQKKEEYTINKRELSPEESKRILSEKITARENLDVNYIHIPNFINEEAEEVISHEETYGTVGIFNMGNTCFMNATLQLLSNTQPLADYFLSDLHLRELNTQNPLGSGGNIVKSFGNIIREIWLGKETAIEPREFLQTLQRHGSRFVEGNQEDCHEFLAFLLDAIHEDLNRVHTKDDYMKLENPLVYHEANNDLEKQAAIDWKNYLEKNRSIIVDLFQGQTKSTLTCAECHNVSHKFEPIMYLSLPIPQGGEEELARYDLGLHECLSEFTKEEIIPKSESWLCEKCNMRVACTKKIEIWKSPNILVIHFKRFKYTSKENKKINVFIDFPIKNLDLGQFLSSTQKDFPVYDLFAVANHEGGLNKGHYYAFAKNDEDKQWYEYDDENVRLIQKPKKTLNSSSAYMLFYAKTSIDYFSRQTLTAPQLWPHIMRLRESLLKNPPTRERVSSLGIRESLRNSFAGSHQRLSKVSQNYVKGMDILSPQGVGGPSPKSNRRRGKARKDKEKVFKSAEGPLEIKEKVKETEKEQNPRKSIDLTTQKRSWEKDEKTAEKIFQRFDSKHDKKRARSEVKEVVIGVENLE